jgi:class 3 adenylate cyclase/tetratricopeptide (TPR) repeat protein
LAHSFLREHRRGSLEARLKCSQCQHENRRGAKFCEECAAPLALACSNCGKYVSPAAKFCPECAHPLSAAPVRSRFAAPNTYTPKHLAEKIVTSKSALEGERKQVTVLFADLKGSMELLADRDPEEARKILDPVLERMMEAVHRYEGTVNQVMGDGIMALFGAPLAHEDHAVRACYAALRMQESVKRYAEEVRRTAGVPLHMRVGLNSGEVVVRSIGSDLRMDYSAVGQTTHLAARMEQMAMPGSILISPSTLRLAEGFVQLKHLGPLPIKGLEAAIDVYEVTGAGSMRSRMEATASRGLTRFVGRESETETLCRALDGARGGHGQVVAIVGEPGVGKSRLLWEFTHSHRTHGWLVLESNSASFGKATPYLPVVDLLKGYFQIEARDDVRKISEKLAGKLVALDPSLQTTLPAFFALLDVPTDDPQWQALDPAQRRQRILEALKRLLLRESQVQPLCLSMEDLHWIDSETQGFLDSLIESLPTTRILLLVNYRPEYQHNWGSKTYYAQLRIDPLPPQRAEELLGALLGEDPRLQQLKQLLIAQTQGNPFFLEESVRTLVETLVLAGERGSYHLVKPFLSIQIPATVQAVLAARIDRLQPDEKRLLLTAAVIGEEFPFTLLQAITEESEEALRRGIARLQTAEFLYETRLFPDPEYAFKHGLTYQVAYGSLLQERRRTLHTRIVEALERLYPDRLIEHIERLAHHAFHGEVWGKAVTYLRRAGTKAAARSAHRDAARCFEQALITLKHLPETRELLEEAIDLRFELRNSLHSLGELSRILDHLHEAEKLAVTLNDQRRLGQVFTLMTQYFRVLGDHDRAVESGQHAVGIAERLDDFPLRIAANTVLGPAYGALGDYRKAIEILGRNVELLQRSLIRESFTAGLQSVFSRVYLVGCLSELGEFGEGIAQAEEGMRVAEAAEHSYSLTFAHFGIGTVFLLKGELQRAIPALERGFGYCRALNLLVMFPLFASALGSTYALSGRFAEALPLLEEAVTQAASMRRMGGHSGLVVRFGEGCLLAGRLDDATQLARSALSLSRALKERGYEAYALHLLGKVAAQREPHDSETAAEHYLQALELAKELGMRPLQAHCHLGLGKLYRMIERDADAHRHSAIASALFREMAMPFWLRLVESD